MPRPVKPAIEIPGLEAGDLIVAAWAEDCEGPGWQNSLISLVVYRQGEAKIIAIQPEFHSDEMRALFGVSAAANLSMVCAAAARTGLPYRVG